MRRRPSLSSSSSVGSSRRGVDAFGAGRSLGPARTNGSSNSLALELDVSDISSSAVSPFPSSSSTGSFDRFSPDRDSQYGRGTVPTSGRERRTVAELLSPGGVESSGTKVQKESMAAPPFRPSRPEADGLSACSQPRGPSRAPPSVPKRAPPAVPGKMLIQNDQQTQQNPPSPAALQMADEHHVAGYKLRREGNFEGAVAEYTAAIKLVPTHFKALFNRGFALDKLGWRVCV